MLSPVDISSGYSPNGDPAGDSTATLNNWELLEPARQGGQRTNVQRPALVARALTGLTADVIGMFRYRDQMIIVTSDRYVYRVSDGAPTSLIALSTTDTATQLDGSARPTFAMDAARCFIAGGGKVSFWQPGNATCARLTTAPNKVTHISALGQRLIANDQSSPGTRDMFFWSDLGVGNYDTWDALSFATAEARPDYTVAIYENTSELLVFGESTLQVYSIGTDPLNPWASAITSNVGCSAPYSPTRIDDHFAFIDDRRRVVLSDGRSINPISNDIESELRAMDSVADAWGWRETNDRFDALVLQFADRTFKYDLKTHAWGERTYSNTRTESRWPVGAHAFWGDVHAFGSSTASALYQLDLTTRLDLGNPIICRRTTGWHDHGTGNRKRSKWVKAVLRRGTADINATPGALEIRVRNDGDAWTPWQQASIGIAGDNVQSVFFTFGGVFRRRQYDIRFSTDDDTALVELSDDVSDLGG